MTPTLTLYTTTQLLDTDGNGTLDLEEISRMLETLGQSPTASSLQDMMAEADIDGDGGVTLAEMLKIFIKAKEPSLSHESVMSRVFDMIDVKGTGWISSADLMQLFNEKFGEHLDTETIMSLMSFAVPADQRQDRISREQFMALVQRIGFNGAADAPTAAASASASS